MHNSVLVKKLTAVACLVLVASAFQNCGSSFNHQDPVSQFLKIGGNGNGQGYPGKVSGAYASLDTTNSCGQNSSSSVAIREKVLIVEGRILKVVENCNSLASPVEVSQAQVNIVDTTNKFMVINNILFQTGTWVEGSTAPAGQFTDFFCNGVDSNGFRVEFALQGGLFSRSRPADHSMIEEMLVNLTGTVNVTGNGGAKAAFTYNDFHQDWHGDDSLEVESDDKVRIRFNSFKLPGPFTPSEFRLNLPGLSIDSFQTSSCWVPF